MRPVIAVILNNCNVVAFFGSFLAFGWPRDAQLGLQARYEEEAHLVESCRDFREANVQVLKSLQSSSAHRQVLHRLDAQAESLAAQEAHFPTPKPRFALSNPRACSTPM